jgi:hypothetical protein
MPTQEKTGISVMRDEMGFGWSMQADVCKSAPLFPTKGEIHVLFFLE